MHWPHILIACVFIIVELFSLFSSFFFLHPITIYPHFSLIRCLFDECNSFFFALVPMYMCSYLFILYPLFYAVWMCTVFRMYRLYWLTFRVCQHWLWIHWIYIVEMDRLDGFLCRVISVYCSHCSYEIIHKTCAMLNVLGSWMVLLVAVIPNGCQIKFLLFISNGQIKMQ